MTAGVLVDAGPLVDFADTSLVQVAERLGSTVREKGIPFECYPRRHILPALAATPGGT